MILVILGRPGRFLSAVVPVFSNFAHVLSTHERDTDLRFRAISELLQPPRCSPTIGCFISELIDFFPILIGQIMDKI